MRGGIGAGAWTVLGLFGIATVVCVDLGGCSGGTEGCGCGAGQHDRWVTAKLLAAVNG